MRIIHFCLSSFYIDNMNYQENALIREHVKAGHEVLVIASTENMDENKKLCYDAPREYIGSEGARVIRLPYKGWPHALAKKIRAYPNVYKMIEEFAPDAMMFHSMCAWELLTVAKYKRNNPDVILYADSHEDLTNSARGFLSKEILHRLFYAPIARKAVGQLQKVLCVSISCLEFMRDFYKLPEEKLLFFPLAGTPISWEKIQSTRKRMRKELRLKETQIVLVQSGKQSKNKKLIESLKAFVEIRSNELRLLIVGTLFEDIRDEAEKLIAADDRVIFLGWKSAMQLTDILCAADVYLQPGTQSSTMQNSLCAGCAVILDDVPSHEPYFVENGWRINGDTSLENIFSEMVLGREKLLNMGKNSNKLAHEILDYSVQANRILKK